MKNKKIKNFWIIFMIVFFMVVNSSAFTSYNLNYSKTGITGNNQLMDIKVNGVIPYFFAFTGTPGNPAVVYNPALVVGGVPNYTADWNTTTLYTPAMFGNSGACEVISHNYYVCNIFYEGSAPDFNGYIIYNESINIDFQYSNARDVNDLGICDNNAVILRHGIKNLNYTPYTEFSGIGNMTALNPGNSIHFGNSMSNDCKNYIAVNKNTDILYFRNIETNTTTQIKTDIDDLFFSELAETDQHYYVAYKTRDSTGTVGILTKLKSGGSWNDDIILISSGGDGAITIVTDSEDEPHIFSVLNIGNGYQLYHFFLNNSVWIYENFSDLNIALANIDSLAVIDDYDNIHLVTQLGSNYNYFMFSTNETSTSPPTEYVNWTVHIRDSDTWFDIENASVFIQNAASGVNYSGDTNVSGQITFTVSTGFHYVTVSKVGYGNGFTSDTIYPYTSVYTTIYLTEQVSLNTIKFKVVDCINSTPINNAKVFYSNTIYPLLNYWGNTSVTGEITFNYTAPIGEDYRYKIIKEGYVDKGWNFHSAPISHYMQTECIQTNRTFNISVHITDEYNGIDLENVYVVFYTDHYVLNRMYSCYTNESGKCELNNTINDYYHVVMSKSGYNDIDYYDPTTRVTKNEQFNFTMLKQNDICTLRIWSYDKSDNNNPLPFTNFNISHIIGNLTTLKLSGTTNEDGRLEATILCSDHLFYRSNKLYYDVIEGEITLINNSITNLKLYHSKIVYTTSIHGYILHGNYSHQPNATKYGVMGVSICAYDSGILISCTESSFILEDGEVKNGYFKFNEVGYDRDIEFRYTKNLFKDGLEVVYIDIMTQNNPLYFTIHDGDLTDFLEDLEDGFTLENFYWFMRYFGWWMILLLLGKVFWVAISGDDKKDNQQISYTRKIGRSTTKKDRGWGLD